MHVDDANDVGALEAAFNKAKATTDRPTLIIVNSIIGWGAPNKQDTSAAHGEPLGEEEVKLAKKRYGWPEDAKFLVPDGVRERFAAGHRRARQGGAHRMAERSSTTTASSIPELAERVHADAARANCPRAGTADIPTFRGGRQGHRHARLVGQGAQRDRRSAFRG